MAKKSVKNESKPTASPHLEKKGKRTSAAFIPLLGFLRQKIKTLLNNRLDNRSKQKDSKIKSRETGILYISRKWKLIQLESSIACNFKCIMCPWEDVRNELNTRGHMKQQVWDSIVPYLKDIQSIDFTGGGEPLLNKKIFDWADQAKKAGCKVGFLTNGSILNKKTVARVINARLDWVAISVDGASKDIYEKIRPGANFQRLCENITTLSTSRVGKKPMLLINFVIMNVNSHQLEDIIKLAARLGVAQVNFKQCDVIRGDKGKGFGLFASEKTRAIKKLLKSLSRAKRLGKKLKVETKVFSFTPEEQPVCEQDPCSSLFIRYDGAVSPCINLAMGGPTTFLGENAVLPTISYGTLPDDNISDLWDSRLCNEYKNKFENRAKIYNSVLIGCENIGDSLIKFQEAFAKARKAMPPAPKGCEICHYLYDI